MSKQTILGRVARLATANVDALLDQAEDPQKMIDQLIRDYTGNIAAAEDAVASTIGELRLMEQDHAEDVAASAEWGGKARAASRRADELRIAGSSAQANRFDRLARVALGRQLQSEREAAKAEPSIAAQNEVIGKLTSGLARMKETLGRLQQKRDELVVRSRSARARDQMLDAIRTVDLLDPTGDLVRFEDKVRREEARLAGRHEMAASSLDAQFESLDPPADTAEVDARLARLKSTIT
jgi:phage shock protein A